MVKEGPEPPLHIVRHEIQHIGRRHRGAAAGKQQREPPQGKARHKGHADEDEQKHQSVAHVSGDHEIKSAQSHGMAAYHHRCRQGLEVPLFLPQPLQLLGQKQREGDFHHLRRADAHRQKGKAQPGPVAALAGAEGRQQQQNKQHVERQNPAPALEQHLKIHHGKEDIQADAQQHGYALHDHIFVALQIPGGTENEHHAEERGYTAKRQQHQVGLLEKVHQNGFQSAQHVKILRFCV